jgi:hypothetical protein
MTLVQGELVHEQIAQAATIRFNDFIPEPLQVDLFDGMPMEIQQFSDMLDRQDTHQGFCVTTQGKGQVASAIEPVDLLDPHATLRAGYATHGYFEPDTVIEQVAFPYTPAVAVVNAGNNRAAAAAAG